MYVIGIIATKYLKVYTHDSNYIDNLFVIFSWGIIEGHWFPSKVASPPTLSLCEYIWTVKCVTMTVDPMIL